MIESHQSTKLLIPPIIGLANIARLSADEGGMAKIWQQLTTQVSKADHDPFAVRCKYAALMDMCVIDQVTGNAERGLNFQSHALTECRLFQLPARQSPAKLRLLGFAAPGKINANTPVEFLIEDSDITLYLLYVVPGRPLPPVPDHDVALVLAAEGDEARPVLQEIERLVKVWPRPVLNRPAQVAELGRERLYKLLAPLEDLIIPPTVRVDRATCRGLANEEPSIESVLPDGGFPIIIRPLDSHAGLGLAKIASPVELVRYLDDHPDNEFHISRFIDYRSPIDGLYRKYRIVVVDGRPFPCHMGVSDHWMIHYVNAGMTDSADKRAEEQWYMDRFTDEFQQRHGYALAQIAELFGLEYFGIDCANTHDGKLLVFEAGTALVVHDMDPPDIFPYKSRHMQAVFAAFHTLLSRKAHR